MEQVSDSGSDFATGTHPLPHHRVIIGTSAVEMGVNFQVDAAIIEPGQDAAALLQRIGRVARGHQSGIVHVSKPQPESAHFIQLKKCKDSIPVQDLREMFAPPLRRFNTKRAKELGRAYWSMLRRCDKHLMAGLEEALVDLMGGEAAVSGKLLDSLWVAEPFPDKRRFMAWLNAIDDTLKDVRGFAPTVKLRFPDRSFTYSRDWVTQHLHPPDNYDAEENTYVYYDIREHCLREKSRPLACTFFHPKGTTGLMSTWTVPSPELWSEYQRLYLNPRDYPSDPDIKRLYERATVFIRTIRLKARTLLSGKRGGVYAAKGIS